MMIDSKLERNKLLEYVTQLNILIVDDEQTLIRYFTGVIERMSGKFDLPNLTVKSAQSYDEAINILFFEEFPADFILLDKELPDGDGIELCASIKNSPGFKNSIIYIISGHVSDSSIRSAALEAGAVSTIDKTTSEASLTHIIQNALDSLSKDKALLYMNRQKEQELQLAKIVQKRLIPDKLPELDNIRTDVIYLPMMDISGDIYDIHLVQDNKLILFLGDVSGHGISAALIAAMTRMALHIYQYENSDPAKLMGLVNDHLYDLISPYYITVFLGILDTRTFILSYCNAGHPSPYLIRSKTGEIIPLEAKGSLIGSLRDPHLERKSIQLLPGDRVLIFTDGITECSNSNGEEYGEEKLVNFLKQPSPKHGEFFKNLMADLNNFKGSNNFQDDVTAILLDIVEE